MYIETLYEKSRNVKTVKEIRKDLNGNEISELVDNIHNETGAIKENIKMYYNNWIKIDNDWYYFKPIQSILYLDNELICEIIAKYFEIDSIHNEFAIINRNNVNYYGLLSKSICVNKYKYMRTRDLELKQYNNITFLKDYNKFIDVTNYDEFIKELKKLFIFDLYCNQIDRHYNNLLFKTTFVNNKINTINLAPLFDYELSFYNKKIYEYSNALAKLNIKQKNNIRTIQNDEYFQMLIRKVLDANMDYFIEELIKKYNIKVSNNYIKTYKNQDRKIKKLILENGLYY